MGLNSKFCSGKGLYVIKCQDCYKIGITGDLNSRMIALQIAVPFKLEIVSWIYRNSLREARSIERELHKKHAEKWVTGEWFRLTDKDLRDIETHNNWFPPERYSDKEQAEFEEQARLSSERIMNLDMEQIKTEMLHERVDNYLKARA